MDQVNKQIVELRRALHQHPELSGSEKETAARMLAFFRPLQPDATLTQLGGHGLAFVFAGSEAGPTVLLRCELDALPIHESNSFPYRSTSDHTSHKCGHDGHMAMMAAVGQALSCQRPAKGRVVLLFQPAEENGSGAAAVLADPRFAELSPHFAFALHNLPGFPLGQVVVRSGTIAAASRGMAITLSGVAAHAAQPETGNSPAGAACEILQQLPCLPGRPEFTGQLAMATVVGARLGKKAFGTAPASAEIWVTLRGDTDQTMHDLCQHAEAVVEKSAVRAGLDYRVHYEDIFLATVNAQRAVDVIQRAAPPLPTQELCAPFRWSEDFGRLTSICEGALFGMGAGTETPELHDPAYDFPDELIPLGVDLWQRIIRECLAEV